MELKNYIASIKDFPVEGILFRDMTPLLQDSEAFKYVIDQFIKFAQEIGANVVVGPESRGFIFGTPVSYVQILALYQFVSLESFLVKQLNINMILSMEQTHYVFIRMLLKKVKKF